MADENIGIANKKLLIVAVVLAALVVVLYNVQIARVRSATKGETLKLLKLRRGMEPGERITDKDLEIVEVETEIAKGLKNFVPADKISYAVTSTIKQSVQRGRWLLYDHVTDTDRNNPSTRITPGWVTHTFAIDPRQSPGEILRIGDRINVLGMMSIKKQGLRTYRIAQNLKVLEIGGQSYRDPSAGSYRRAPVKEGQRQVQRVTVEVPPDVSLQLASVLTHVRGSLWIEVRNPIDAPRGRKDPEIHEELRALGAVTPGIRDMPYRPPNP